MNRRNFIQTSTLAAPMAVGGFSIKEIFNKSGGKHDFQLKYAPHLGMFKHHAGSDPVDQINFMAEMGFRAFEDNGMSNRDVDVQKKMGDALAKNGMDMGVFVAHKIYWNEPNLAGGDEDLRAEFLDYIKKSVEVAKRVNAKWMTVVPGHLDLRKEMGYQTQNVVESLKQASEILEPHGLVMVLEPLNFMNHPGLFLTKSAQAYEICKHVDSPSCKILYDIYHQQITEGNLIPNIEQSWDEIAYFQIGDNPGRKEPTTGEINYKNVFKYIHSKGYNDILGMEHGNFYEGKEGEEKLIQAYVESDSF
ncbi:hydroxypyruvate isomerase family protein [Portibacter marinus]|uniref:hydroxypyruvate isomerase family protein n=1 Tax=Portibacter marinus TaxID=2898660 RepID=UPI001F2AD1F0|nr:TIM barrel protein [Portibacter marinus]